MTLNPIWRLAEGGLERIAVDGGWIYRDTESGALCFVPAAAVASAALPRPRAVPDAAGQAA